jgi:hypothetical protein
MDTLIAEKFNLSNRADLWALRTYHGHNALRHVYCDAGGRLQDVEPSHADRLIASGRNVYVNVPLDPACPLPQYRPDHQRDCLVASDVGFALPA